MKHFIPIIFILTYFFSCSIDDKKENYYVIKDISKKINSKNDSITKMLPVLYGKHNFILINNSKIYYHKYNPRIGCGWGRDFTKPPRLYLTPDSLKEIKLKDLEKFLNKLVKEKANSGKQIIIISSPTDTVKNKALTLITLYFESKKEYLVGVKKCTEEEEYVGYAKLKKRKYNPSEIKWKIGFDLIPLPPPKNIDYHSQNE